MGSVKVVLQKSFTDTHGRNAIILQVNHQYKTRRKKLFFVNAKYWADSYVKRSHPDQAYLNEKIRNILNEYEARIKELDDLGLPYSVDDIMDTGPDTFLEAIMSYEQRLLSLGKRPASKKMKHLAARVEQFDPEIMLPSVGTEWINHFEAWLKKQEMKSGQKFKSSTISKFLSAIKTVLRYEFENQRYFDQKTINMKIPSYRVRKERLSRSEFDDWCNKDLPEDLIMYRDFFAAMVFLRGLRVSDTLQLTHDNYQDGYIVLVEQKTGKNRRIKVLPELAEIFDRYKGMSWWYLFPILNIAPSSPKTDERYQKHIQAKTAVLNNKYKLISAYVGIRKKVTNHIARHTFTTIADKSGMDSRTISKLLNHSSITATEPYLGELRRDDELDDAMDDLFGNSK